jgi:hypothetical protein
VGGGIDAAGEAGDDAEAGLTEIVRKPFGEFHASPGRIARAHNGDHRMGERRDISPHRDQGRRVVDHLQPQRIVGLAEGNEGRAERARGAQLALGLLDRIDARRPRCAAAARQLGQRLEGCARAATMVDERAEGARTDVLAPDQPQPVEPLLFGQADAVDDIGVRQMGPPAACGLGASIAQRPPCDKDGSDKRSMVDVPPYLTLRQLGN